MVARAIVSKGAITFTDNQAQAMSARSGGGITKSEREGAKYLEERCPAAAGSLRVNRSFRGRHGGQSYDDVRR